MSETAGPSVPRIPTVAVSSEEEEAALESGIIATSTDDTVNVAAEEAQIATGVVPDGAAGADGMDVDGQANGSGGYANIPTGPAADQAPAVDINAIPDNACETLYIQNLNEKVQVEGVSYRSILRRLIVRWVIPAG